VHQDGLVHVSQLADRFVKDPHEVVKTGDVVSVRVTEVDVARKRIGLSMRKESDMPQDRADARGSKGQPPARPEGRGTPRSYQDKPKPEADSGLGAALRDALRNRT